MLNRMAKRKLNKELKKLNREDKASLLMAVQQQTVTKALNDVDPQMALNSMETAMMLIYETYLEPIANNPDMLELDKQKLLNEMVNYISNEYLKAKIKREKEKARVNSTKQEPKVGEKDK